MLRHHTKLEEKEVKERKKSIVLPCRSNALHCGNGSDHARNALNPDYSNPEYESLDNTE